MQSSPSTKVARGTRVQIVYTLLGADERAPGVPVDTAKTPYLVRARGILIEDGALAQPVRIRTQAGRILQGELEEIEPGDTHSFGHPPHPLTEAVEAIQDLARSL